MYLWRTINPNSKTFIKGKAVEYLMERKMIERLVGRKAYFELISNRKYTGSVESCDDNSVYLIDKFGKLVMITYDEIKLVQEEK